MGRNGLAGAQVPVREGVKAVIAEISEKDTITSSLGRATAFTAVGWRVSRIELAYAWEKCLVPVIGNGPCNTKAER